MFLIFCSECMYQWQKRTQGNKKVSQLVWIDVKYLPKYFEKLYLIPVS